MPKIPLITDAERKVMKLLWAKSPQPAYDLATTLAETEQWHPNTVKTLLSRLHKKKAVSAMPYKNLFLYQPLVTEEDCIQMESQSFLDRLFGGAVKPMLLHFVKSQKLTASDLDELRKILKQNGR